MGSSSSDIGSLSLTFESDEPNYDKERALSELDKTNAGVQGLVKSGISQVPGIFILPKEHRQGDSSATDDGKYLQVPTIDLQGCEGERRKDIVSEIRRASETWGMFQLINHGIPQDIINSLLESIREFHEQPAELKGKFYSRNIMKAAIYHIGMQAIGVPAWRDTLSCRFDNNTTEEDLEAIPTVCRKPMSDYINRVKGLKDTLYELLSEALGLKSDFLKELGCLEQQRLAGHCYPACPEPHLAMGAIKHSDASFLTILVQNHINGLQVLYENKWIDLQPTQGAVIVNIGDMLQLISNDIFKSAEHRVLARETGPRLSAACFLSASGKDRDRAYGPIKELSRCDPVYRETSVTEYIKIYTMKLGLGSKGLNELRQ